MKNAAGKNQSLHRKFSAQLVDGPDRAASRAMLHAVGFTTDDFKKSQIGIASTWSMVTPCNMHIDKLAVEAAEIAPLLRLHQRDRNVYRVEPRSVVIGLGVEPGGLTRFRL